MSAYQLTAGTMIIRTADGALIPPDPSNAAYKTYLAWIAAGNAVDPVLGPTPAQALVAFKDSVQAALTATDLTMCRIGEGVTLGLTTGSAPDVVTWVSYRRALRSLLSATVPSNLPARPPYPAGT